MDKNAIKRYAVWARTELMEKVAQKALQYGIEEDKKLEVNTDSINGVLLTDVEKRQRDALIRRIDNEGYKQVIEEVAYTWFNRFIALRFMEVNGYLPTHIRVFSDENNSFKPQILSEALHLEMDNLDREKVISLKQANKNEELFKYLLILQCNSLYSVLPGMFQEISDYTELLLPDYLLREGSVIEQMVSTIPEEDWTNQVQIIGWLYQYYNTEFKNDVFSSVSAKKKIQKNEIAPATQLFTPDWIVKYLVENSLGRLWREGHDDFTGMEKWSYYVDNPLQDDDVERKLNELRQDLVHLSPQDIKCIDPCMGSGHILTYMFDILVQIYESYGFSSREAASLIVENNIYGLDIDKRATQLAYFSIMMKARQYDRRFFSKSVRPNLESFHGLDMNKESFSCEELRRLAEVFSDADEIGSLMEIKDLNIQDIEKALSREETNIFNYEDMEQARKAIQIAKILTQKYDAVVTNPPYMAISNADKVLASFVKENYPNNKNDMYAVFIERCGKLLKRNGLQAMITQHGWMFLSKFKKMRVATLKNSVVNMVHLGAHAFEEIGGEVVQTTAFVLRKGSLTNHKGTYIRLVDGESQDAKERLFLSGNCRYEAIQDNFDEIPDSPVAYWLDEKALSLFFKGESVSDYADPKQGLATSDNNRFLRLWFEVDSNNESFSTNSREEAKESGKKWFALTKGGEFRRWYGNNYYVVNWSNDGKEMKDAVMKKYPYLNSPDFVVKNQQYYFREGVSWSTIATKHVAFRYCPPGFIMETKGSICYPYDKDNMKYILGYLNSSVCEKFADVLSPTLDLHEGPVGRLPIVYDKNLKNEIDSIVQENIEISKADWDAYEISWDYRCNPLISGKSEKIEDAVERWIDTCIKRNNRIRDNENRLNELFTKIFGLDDSYNVQVTSDDVAVSIPQPSDIIKDLISYAVGCMFGRYSLHKEGLQCASPDDEITDEFVDKDNIIPISSDEYFNDDIVTKFCDFINVSFGEKFYSENINYISTLLGGDDTPQNVIRNYFLTEFYKDHCSKYSVSGAGCRPIYWLFDSGKKNGFKCLMYVHRYQPDTIARIRTDYVHELQERYRTDIEDITIRVKNCSGNEKVKLTKQLNTLKAQDEEIHVYEEKIHHLADQMISINLDDGVKKNYEIFKDVLAKLK